MNRLNIPRFSDIIVFAIIGLFPLGFGFFWVMSLLQSESAKDYIASSILFGPLTIMLIVGWFVMWQQREHDKFKLIQVKNGDWVIYYNWRGEWSEHLRAKTEKAVLKKHNKWFNDYCKHQANRLTIRPY